MPRQPRYPPAKILCLHGWGTSPEFMDHQLRNFDKFFPEMKFECMAGPVEMPETIINDASVVKLSPSRKYYSWKLNIFDEVTAGDSMDLTIAMDSICDYINKNGPFDGICGFSQGGMVAQNFIEKLEAGLLNDKLKVAPPRFVLLCAPNYFKTNNDLLRTPSIHLVGDKDFLMEASVLVTTKYLNPLVLRHAESHKFPKLSQYEIDSIRKYLNPILKAGVTAGGKNAVPRPKL